MITFYTLAALMLLAGLFVVLRPLAGKARFHHIEVSEVNLQLYQQQLAELHADLENDVLSQEQFEAARHDLEQKLLADIPEQDQKDTYMVKPSRAAIISVLIGVSGLAIGLYAYLGDPRAVTEVTGTRVAANPHQGTTGTAANPNAPSVAEMVTKLEERLQQEPDNAEGWMLLARAYMHLQEFAKAEKAFEKLVTLVKPDADILANYADVVAVNQKGRLDGKPMNLIEQALKLNPDHPKALWLAGTYYYDQKNYAQATKVWKHLRTLLPAGSEDAHMLSTSIADAQRKMGIEPEPEPVQQAQAPSPQIAQPGQASTASAASITGEVRISPDLVSQVSPDDTVFVFARAVSGPRMPLAVVRKQVRDLPFSFTLDDSMAMMPQMKLSNFPQVSVSARISRSGNAMPQAGDLVSEAIVADTGSNKPLALEITKKVE